MATQQAEGRRGPRLQDAQRLLDLLGVLTLLPAWDDALGATVSVATAQSPLVAERVFRALRDTPGHLDRLLEYWPAHVPVPDRAWEQLATPGTHPGVFALASVQERLLPTRVWVSRPGIAHGLLRAIDDPAAWHATIERLARVDPALAATGAVAAIAAGTAHPLSTALAARLLAAAPDRSTRLQLVVHVGQHPAHLSAGAFRPPRVRGPERRARRPA